MRTIEFDTVLVLGAGASASYGYPTGSQLRDNIIAHTAAGAAMWRNLLDLGFPDYQIEAFRTDLERSGRYSVDAFLEGRQERIPIGKAAMAIHLIGCEFEQRLFAPQGDDWYRHLLEQMRAAPEFFSQNKLSMITFNYDRSFEHYLFTSLHHSYGDEKAAITAAMSIPIVHVHGDLGPLPWQGRSKPRPYGRELNQWLIREAAEGIKIMHEADDLEAEFDRAWQLLLGADRVFVLGFSYAEQNCLRLGLDKLPKRAVGMGFGMRKAEIQTAARVTNGKVDIVDQTLTCEAWLREHVELTAPKN